MRVHRFTGTFVLSAFLTLSLLADPTAAPATATPTPDVLWQALLTGNQQYVTGKLTYDHLRGDREIVAAGQFPPFTVLTCSDSRVPTELVFNQTVGGLFVIRTAGNIADTFGVASIEYAIANGWTSVLVVLAHQECGAVKAALSITDPPTPSLSALVHRIRGSFYGTDWDASNKDAVKKATIANAKAAAAGLLADSAVIRSAVAEGKVKVIVAYYSTDTGAVTRVE
jgi:carbonic anhydrase